RPAQSRPRQPCRAPVRGGRRIPGDVRPVGAAVTTAGPPPAPSPLVRVWRQRRGTLLIVSANIAVAVTIAFVTAVLALVVEGLLPVDGPRKYSGLRWGVLAVAVVLLIAVIAWRSTIRRHRGTLFYVRLLDQTMNDWHVRAVDLAARRRLALRP